MVLMPGRKTQRSEKAKHMIKTWTTALLLFLLAAPPCLAADSLKAFPPAEPGMARHVLRLPMQGDESAFRVELIIGKTLQLDAHNRYFFGGRLEQEVIPGWGYTRYRLAQLGPLAGTLMAVDPKAPKVARFVTLGGEPTLIRYNSKLPVVVYVPTGVEVRYRIWSTGTAMSVMEKG